MGYKIYCSGTLIAEFLYEQDRNDCLSFLQNKYNNFVFTKT